MRLDFHFLEPLRYGWIESRLHRIRAGYIEIFAYKFAETRMGTDTRVVEVYFEELCAFLRWPARMCVQLRANLIYFRTSLLYTSVQAYYAAMAVAAEASTLHNVYPSSLNPLMPLISMC